LLGAIQIICDTLRGIESKIGQKTVTYYLNGPLNMDPFLNFVYAYDESRKFIKNINKKASKIHFSLQLTVTSSI